jgi:Glyoxalase-like domain
MMDAPTSVRTACASRAARKNRRSLDIVIDDIEAEIERLRALGANRLDEESQNFGDTNGVRMSDPEHNEFCVCTGVWSTTMRSPRGA